MAEFKGEISKRIDVSHRAVESEGKTTFGVEDTIKKIANDYLKKDILEQERKDGIYGVLGQLYVDNDNFGKIVDGETQADKEKTAKMVGDLLYLAMREEGGVETMRALGSGSISEIRKMFWETMDEKIADRIRDNVTSNEEVKKIVDKYDNEKKDFFNLKKEMSELEELKGSLTRKERFEANMILTTLSEKMVNMVQDNIGGVEENVKTDYGEGSLLKQEKKIEKMRRYDAGGVTVMEHGLPNGEYKVAAGMTKDRKTIIVEKPLGGEGQIQAYEIPMEEFNKYNPNYWKRKADTVTAGEQKQPEQAMNFYEDVGGDNKSEEKAKIVSDEDLLELFDKAGGANEEIVSGKDLQEMFDGAGENQEEGKGKEVYVNKYNFAKLLIEFDEKKANEYFDKLSKSAQDDYLGLKEQLSEQLAMAMASGYRSIEEMNEGEVELGEYLEGIGMLMEEGKERGTDVLFVRILWQAINEEKHGYLRKLMENKDEEGLNDALPIQFRVGEKSVEREMEMVIKGLMYMRNLTREEAIKSIENSDDNEANEGGEQEEKNIQETDSERIKREAWEKYDKLYEEMEKNNPEIKRLREFINKGLKEGLDDKIFGSEKSFKKYLKDEFNMNSFEIRIHVKDGDLIKKSNLLDRFVGDVDNELILAESNGKYFLINFEEIEEKKIDEVLAFRICVKNGRDTFNLIDPVATGVDNI